MIIKKICKQLDAAIDEVHECILAIEAIATELKTYTSIGVRKSTRLALQPHDRIPLRARTGKEEIRKAGNYGNNSGRRTRNTALMTRILVRRIVGHQPGARIDLARKLGVSSAAVTHWCNGTTRPTLNHMINLRRMCGASAGDIA